MNVKIGQNEFLKTRAKLAEHPVEKVGAELRGMMPWIGKKNLSIAIRSKILVKTT